MPRLTQAVHPTTKNPRAQKAEEVETGIHFLMLGRPSHRPFLDNQQALILLYFAEHKDPIRIIE